MIAELILRKNKLIVNKLIHSGRADLNIIALILCESHFRKRVDRIIEYLAMPILLFVSKKRFYRLSIGIGQIQLRHWKKINTGYSPISIYSYFTYFSVQKNYDILKELINMNLSKGYTDSKLIAFHTGETRNYHFALFQELKNKIKTVSNNKTYT
ncbi:MAG: hypothetical protein ACPG4W_00785 [Flavobacteriales bacterium]